MVRNLRNDSIIQNTFPNVRLLDSFSSGQKACSESQKCSSTNTKLFERGSRFPVKNNKVKFGPLLRSFAASLTIVGCM